MEEEQKEEKEENLIEEFWNTPSNVDYGLWDENDNKEKKIKLFNIKKEKKEKKEKKAENKAQPPSETEPESMTTLAEDIENQKQENSVLIEQFWKSDIRNEIDSKDGIYISKNQKIIIASIGGIIALIFILTVGINIFQGIEFNHIQKMLYNLAETEMSDGGYDSAKSHFVQIDEKSKYYSEAVRKIKQIESAQRCIEKAWDAYNDDNMELAQANIDSAKIVIDNFAECEEIQALVDERKKQKRQLAGEYITNCQEALGSGNMQEAVKNYKLAYELAKGDEDVDKLYESIREYALERLKVGEDYYYKGDMLQAQIIFNELKEIDGFDELHSLYLKLDSYYDAQQLIEDAKESFEQGSNQEALELINEAWEMNEYSKALSTELVKQVNEAIEQEKKMEEYKSKLEISSVSFIENQADGKFMTTAMFDIKLTGLDILIFNDCWITLEKGDTIIQPTPMYEQRYAVVTKILENGQTSPDLEYDIVYMKKDEKYRVMIKFEGKKEDLKGAKLIYTDMNNTNENNENEPIKIELGKVE